MPCHTLKKEKKLSEWKRIEPGEKGFEKSYFTYRNVDTGEIISYKELGRIYKNTTHYAEAKKIRKEMAEERKKKLREVM
jgi:hypothetical protein